MIRSTFFFKNHAESEEGRLVICNLISMYFDGPQLRIQQKQTVKNFRLLIQRYAQFWLLKKFLGIISPPYFVFDFSRKTFLMLYPLNWPHIIAWLPLVPERLRNLCIAIACYPGWDAKNLKINRIFVMKPFFYVAKKSI